MSDSDNFINEVTEEVRRDRLFGLIRKYGWIAILLVVLMVGTAAWIEWQRASKRADAEAFGDAIVAALGLETDAERRDALSQIDAEGGRAALIAMLSAGAMEDDGSSDAVRADLEQVSGDETVPQLYRDLATLKLVMIQQDEVSPEDILERLDPLTAPGRPYRLLAEEQRALAQVRAGDNDAALTTLDAIRNDGAATRDLQRRVQQLIIALGGTLDTTSG
ncbi:tetratricopeptide repeat protein [Palleronia caenipelagi]|uniref:Tetratricopeptide repeat protein n=1 Tax=Palleronia caenipelagi TaxID=2489174 RepID=A0A547Q360_9RHOB|nr:tetratricopeptide repeat protein [Palleronia caenipelagi]TRD20800.1 tetratricopeptide repeat protein [Palleronia caenipelagi]